MGVERLGNTGSNPTWRGEVREGFPEEAVLEPRQTSHSWRMRGLCSGVVRPASEPSVLEHPCT